MTRSGHISVPSPTIGKPISYLNPAALSAGLGSGLVMLIAGSLYAAYGGGAYPFMAVLSALGLGGALWLRRLSRQGGTAGC